jgi:hypothetical protein
VDQYVYPASLIVAQIDQPPILILTDDGISLFRLSITDPLKINSWPIPNTMITGVYK